jgi:hypothetical protein
MTVTFKIPDPDAHFEKMQISTEQYPNNQQERCLKKWGFPLSYDKNLSQEKRKSLNIVWWVDGYHYMESILTEKSFRTLLSVRDRRNIAPE